MSDTQSDDELQLTEEQKALLAEEEAMEAAYQGEQFVGEPPPADETPTLGDEPLYQDQIDAAKEREEQERKEAEEQAAAEAEAEAKKPFEELQQEIETLRGDIRNRDGKFGDLNRQLIAANETIKNLQQSGVADLDPEVVRAAIMDTPEFKDQLDEYPEMAGGIQKAIENAITAALKKPAPAAEPPAGDGTGTPAGDGGEAEAVTVDAVADKVVEKLEEKDNESAMADLEEKHKDWGEVVNSVDYGRWSIEQGDDIRALEASDNPADVITLMDKYKAFAEWRGGLGDEYANFSTGALLELHAKGELNPPQPGDDDESDELSPEERLKAGVNATDGSSPGSDTGSGKTEEDYMEEGYKRTRG